MKLRDLMYVMTPMQHVVVINRDYDGDFDDYDVLYSGMWYRMSHVRFNMEVVDMYIAKFDLHDSICLEVKYVSDFTEDDVS